MTAKYLLTAQEIEDMEGVQKTHFLNENAKRLNKSLGDATGLTGLGVHLIEVGPNCETSEYHCHYHEDECVYVLSGQGVSIVDGVRQTINAGDFIGYPKGGAAHNIENDSEETLRLLVIGQRLDHDVGDYPNAKKRIYRQKGMPWQLVDLNAIETLDASVGKK